MTNYIDQDNTVSTNSLKLEPAERILRLLQFLKEEGLKMGPDMIDVEHRRRPIEFCFWIDGNIAKRGLSLRWLTQTQEGEETYLDEHGRERHRVLIRATAYNEWRAIQQLLKYGDKAELMSPPHLREQMKRVVECMHAYYTTV